MTTPAEDRGKEERERRERELRKSAHRIHIGGVYASREPAVIYTLLGSCIAVALRDPLMQVGGLNHFMLPMSSDGEETSSRYGVQAMELLINACMTKGADRARLEAKVFGGGHVLRIQESAANVPRSNIKFALEFLQLENIPIVSRDVGGYVGREIYFFTDSGRTLLKRMASGVHRAHGPLSGPEGQGLSAAGTPHGDKTLASVESREREHLRALAKPVPPADDSNITLF